jgi:hypothetical protein
MNYIIRVIDKAGKVIARKEADERPSEDELKKLAILCNGEFCDIARTD